MTVLSGLPANYEHLRIAIDIFMDQKKLTLELFKRRLLKYEQRLIYRTTVAGPVMQI